MRMRIPIILILCLVFVFAARVLTTGAQAAAPTPGNYRWVEVAGATGFARPLLVTHAGDNRLFIVEQGGFIKIWQNGAVLPTPFLDVSGLVSTSGNEQGLLGLAFSPTYAQDGYFYINYTDRSGDTVVARYQVSGNANVANTTATRVLFVDQPFSNHNGGHMAFGPDRLLYIGMGDGGSGGDPNNYAQNPQSQLGKMLRVNVAQATFPVQIFASGLRNPWRWSFDRATGDLYIGDVGQGSREEVNFWPAAGGPGANYGWKRFEGTAIYDSSIQVANPVMPFYDYGRPNGACSVTGGNVYRGTAMPELQGIYFFADFCNGQTWSAFRNGQTWTVNTFIDTPYFISSFGEDVSGELYVADHNGGRIYRLQSNRPTNTPTPRPTNTPTPFPPTVTPLPPTMTATPLPPTATLTFTPVPPTATATFTPLPTNTAVPSVLPPTATTILTNTPVPTQATLSVLAPVNATVGQSVQVALGLNSVTDLYGLQTTCSVNPSVLSGVSLTEGDGFNAQNSFIVNRNFQANGSWMVAASRLQPAPVITGNATAYTLVYNVVGAGETAISCEVLAVDRNGSDIRLSVVNGTFTGIAPEPTATQTPLPTATNTPLPTDMPTLVPTNTPEPTFTPTATNTPEPTFTPTATNTPEPTFTLTPTVEPSATPLPVTGSIVGMLKLQGRTDNSGILVELLDVNAAVLTSQTTAADGAVTFASLPPGSYTLRATATGYLALVIPATVGAAGEPDDVSVQTLLAGDTDNNGIIDLADAGLIGANFDVDVPPAPATADLNADGTVDIRDLVLIGINFGRTGPIIITR
jgi:glucose/arabinose dehydrogenase